MKSCLQEERWPETAARDQDQKNVRNESGRENIRWEKMS